VGGAYAAARALTSSGEVGMDPNLEHLFSVTKELAQLGSWQQDLRTG
jgi:hypothetical protein